MRTLDDNHDGTAENFPNKIIPEHRQSYSHKGTDSNGEILSSIGWVKRLK